MAELNAESSSFAKLMANGNRYRVPLYQRDYSWDTDNWEELWADILEVYEKRSSIHYLGSIVVQHEGEKAYQIIDGQQRVTTLSVLTLAIIRCLEKLAADGQAPDDNRERARQFREDFIGRKDAVSLRYGSKLTLNQQNDAFYQLHLVQIKEPRLLNRENDSNQRLYRAQEFFYDKLHTSGLASNGGHLAELARCVGEGLLFIQISVDNELSAFTVFETLNYDGLRLTVTDLLKNYLFSRFPVGSNDLHLINEQWRKIVEAVGLDRFGTFLRHYWLANHALIREDRLFKAIRQQITTAADADALLTRLESAASVYAALTDPEDDHWNNDSQARADIRALNLFGVRLHLPLLIAAELHLPREEARRVLHSLVALSFRYTVIGKQQTNRLEEVYQRSALAVTNHSVVTAREVWGRYLRDFYPDDATFRMQFEQTRLSAAPRTRKLLRYILFGLENQLAATDRDPDNDPATIEHILPDSAAGLADWGAFSAEDHLLLRDRLGNYTLLEATSNRQLQTAAYDEKQPVYAASQYALAQQAQYPVFEPKQLKDRQRDLARVATAVWRSPWAG